MKPIVTDPTQADIARLFEDFKDRGPHEWPDGTLLADGDVALAFARDLWLMVLESGQGGAFLPGWSSPAETLTGASGLRASAEQVNRSLIGRRWARKGAPLARRDFWEEIVVPLPNPSDIVWGYSRDLGSFAGAGVVEGGVFMASFPAAAYTPTLAGLRDAVPSRQDSGGNPAKPDEVEALYAPQEATPLRVVVADRHQLVRQGLLRYLGTAEFEVVATAVDGAQALRLVGELRPDVLITDIRLPVIDGLQLAATIGEHFPSVRVVILTAYDDRRFIEAATATGVAAYVLKGDSAEKLISAIRTAVQKEVDPGPDPWKAPMLDADKPLGADGRNGCDMAAQPLVLADDESVTVETPTDGGAEVAAQDRPSVSCSLPGCGNEAVRRADACRAHLLLQLREDGVFVPGGDSPLAEIAGAVVFLTSSMVSSLPSHVVDAAGPYVDIDMYASIHPDAAWQLSQLGLDVLGSTLIDRVPFLGMSLEAPMEFGPDVLLRLKVGVPVSAAGELRPRLESLLADVVREIVGPEARITCIAEPDTLGDDDALPGA